MCLILCLYVLDKFQIWQALHIADLPFFTLYTILITSYIIAFGSTQIAGFQAAEVENDFWKTILYMTIRYFAQMSRFETTIQYYTPDLKQNQTDLSADLKQNCNNYTPDLKQILYLCKKLKSICLKETLLQN